MSAASAPTHAPARGPSATPATTVIVVTGCTLGIAANRILPAAAAAASVPTSASSLLEPGPDSSQATPATISAPANRSSARAESFGWSATQAAEASAPSSANAAAALCNCELPHRRGRDDAVGDPRREKVVVGDDERRPARRLRAQETRQLVLALGVDAARGLVEDQQIGVGNQHGRERQAFPLAAGEVARMTRLEAGQPHLRERPPRLGEVAAYGQRDLLVGALGNEIAARVLAQVAGAAPALHTARPRGGQARGELGERPPPCPRRAKPSDEPAP